MGVNHRVSHNHTTSRSPSEADNAQNRTLLNGVDNGGPAGLIHGYIFVWCGASLQALVMAKMASMYVHLRIIISLNRSFGSLCIGHPLSLDLLVQVVLTFGSLGGKYFVARLENNIPANFLTLRFSIRIFQLLRMYSRLTNTRIPVAGGPSIGWLAYPLHGKKFLSYLAEWLTVITWQACIAGVTYVTVTLVQGLLILNYPSYDYQRWHGTLLFYAVLALALSFNTCFDRLLSQVEPMMLFFHVIGFFSILILLVYLGPQQPAKEVFTTFLNVGDWSTTGLSFFVGLMTAMNSFPGRLENGQS